jgi:predicted DsbA family dithiol-disulfide isomerase
MKHAMNVNVTYFIDITSSWCHWAEPAWAELKQCYRDRVAFEWRIALLPKEALPVSRAQAEWFYRRSGTIVRSPYMLNPGWLEPEPGHGVYDVPNLVAEAARALGAADDRVRLSLAHAAMREGRKIGRWDEAIEVASTAAKLDPVALKKLAASPDIAEKVQASTAQFHEFKMTQRPSFLLENNLHDRAMLSGIWKVEPLAAVIETMLRDSADYAVHAAHFGGVPAS